MQSNVQVVAIRQRSKRLRLWTVRSDHTIWSRSEEVPRCGRSWEPETDRWHPQATPFEAAAVHVSARRDGTHQFWAVDAEGRVWSCREDGEDSWTAWTTDWARAAASFRATTLAAAPLSDGRLQFWAVDRDGTIHSCWELASGPGWTKWRERWTPRRPGFEAAALSTAPLADRRLQFLAVDTSGAMWSCRKSTTKSSARWTEWQKDVSLPFTASTVTAAALSDGRLQLWAVDRDGAIWSRTQIGRSPSSSWTAWTVDWLPAAAPFAAVRVAAAPVSDGALHLWAIDEDGRCWHCWQIGTGAAAWTIFGLFFPMQAQKYSNWCWAATAASVSQFYDPASTWRQCDIVNAHLHHTICCESGQDSGCNVTAFLREVLYITGNFAETKERPLTEEELHAELTRGRPVAARVAIRRNNTKGHFVAVSGSGGGWVVVKDPWVGPKYLAYDVFCERYMTEYAWKRAFLTKPEEE